MAAPQASAPPPPAPVPGAPVPQYPGQAVAAGAPPPQPQYQPQMYPPQGVPAPPVCPHGQVPPPQSGTAVYGYPVQQTMGQPVQYAQPGTCVQPNQYQQYGTSGTVTYGQGGAPVYRQTVVHQKKKDNSEETACLAFLAGCAFCCCLESML
eukprot:TRINITY_DN352_c1_g2_i1.p1 TRINITY_DN352_c1_g2~~TRINITY_DN352_c1_g2_i1.p1  ORF type:complete len:167 (+),score=49.89 TRINITY_DN352_c1_g2_i1:51-503(+)